MPCALRCDRPLRRAWLGGWDLGAKEAGLTTLGIEIDPWTVKTRHAAALPTRHGDVRDFGPDTYRTRGLIGSPPCQPFSRAGKQQGTADLDAILMQVAWLAQGAENRAHYRDHRTELVTEPLRWALQAKDAGHPYTWIALEQVPAVLPIWMAVARVLRDEGYSVVTGVLSCEQFGVPQTRSRAVLVADRQRRAKMPLPTHSRYYPHDPKRRDHGVLPWVTMAQALGWTGKVGFARRDDRGGDGYRERDLRDTSLPAQAVTEKTRSWLVQSGMSRATTRSTDEPAPTVTAAHDHGERRWVFDRPATTVVGSFQPQVVAAPGWRKDPAVPRQDAPDSVRVSIREAAILQGFPPDHPWRGPRTRVYEQIGNAFPPPVAKAILSRLTQE